MTRGVLAERVETIELAPLNILAAISPSSINADARTADVVFYTGAAIRMCDWSTGEPYLLTLSLETADVRLDRLNTSGQLLDTHNSYELSAVLGAIEPGSARIEKGQAVATVRFSKRAEVEPIWQDVQDRIIRNVSVGANFYKFEQTEATDKAPMKRHATDWEPHEVSLVPIGADPGARVKAADTRPTHPCVIVMRASQEDQLMEPTTTPAVTPAATPPQENPNGGAPVVASNPQDPGAPTGERTEPEVVGAHQAGTAAERNRVDVLMKAVLAVGLPVELALDLIRKGISVEAGQGLVIEEVSRRGRGGDGPGERPSGVRGGRDAHDHVRAGITDALLHRVAPQFFALGEVGKLYRGRSVLTLAEYFLQSMGERTTHLSKQELFERAFSVQAAGYHTTSDFPNILGDVANKTLRRSYDEAPQTFAAITKRTELTDFKPVRRTQLSEAPALLEVLEHGEIQHGTMGDAKEQYQLATFAVQFGLTRQAMINDDTNAFGNLAVQFGRMARHKESDLVWAQITGNPVMGDGNALFSAAHANVSAGAGAIAIGTVTDAMVKLAAQRGLAGVEFLNLTPAYLIVPSALRAVALQFVSTNMQATQTSNVNPFAGTMTVISDQRLDVNSTTVWYVAASVAQVDMIELGFLSGQNGPTVTSRFGWDVDGLETKVVHDVAAKVIDHRGFYRNAA